MDISSSLGKVHPASTRDLKHLTIVVALLMTMSASFVSCAPPNPIVNTYVRGNMGQGNGNAPKDSLMYIRVMKKMDTFCEMPYKESDDRRIGMYSKCFSQLIKAVSTREKSDSIMVN